MASSSTTTLQAAALRQSNLLNDRLKDMLQASRCIPEAWDNSLSYKNRNALVQLGAQLAGLNAHCTSLLSYLGESHHSEPIFEPSFELVRARARARNPQNFWTNTTYIQGVHMEEVATYRERLRHQVTAIYQALATNEQPTQSHRDVATTVCFHLRQISGLCRELSVMFFNEARTIIYGSREEHPDLWQRSDDAVGDAILGTGLEALRHRLMVEYGMETDSLVE